MTLIEMLTLSEVVSQGIDALPNAPVREVVHWIQLNRRSTIEANFETLSSYGLAAMVRAAKKRRSPKEQSRYSHNLCLDFGLPDMAIDTEISVPQDLDNLMNSECDWPDPDDATIDDIDRHILLLKAQGKATLAHAQDWKRLRQKAFQYSPHGRTDITLGELRKIARRQRGLDEEGVR